MAPGDMRLLQVASCLRQLAPVRPSSLPTLLLTIALAWMVGRGVRESLGLPLRRGEVWLALLSRRCLGSLVQNRLIRQGPWKWGAGWARGTGEEGEG